MCLKQRRRRRRRRPGDMVVNPTGSVLWSVHNHTGVTGLRGWGWQPPRTGFTFFHRYNRPTGHLKLRHSVSNDERRATREQHTTKRKHKLCRCTCERAVSDRKNRRHGVGGLRTSPSRPLQDWRCTREILSVLETSGTHTHSNSRLIRRHGLEGGGNKKTKGQLYNGQSSATRTTTTSARSRCRSTAIVDGRVPVTRYVGAYDT